MKKLLPAILAVSMASCTTINNVSSRPPLKEELGDKHLIKGAFICAIDNKALFEKGLPNNVIYENHGFKSCPYGKDVATLHAGATINIDEASHRSHFGIVSYSDHWYLLGSTNVDGRVVHFYYYLGLTTDGKPPADYKDNLLWQ